MLPIVLMSIKGQTRFWEMEEEIITLKDLEEEVREIQAKKEIPLSPLGRIERIEKHLGI